MAQAYSSENGGPEAEALISPMSCSLVGSRAWLNLIPGSILRSIYGLDRVEERFNCSYGLNATFKAALEETGLVFSGQDDQGQVRAAELPGRGFFLGTLFLPQLSSTPDRPHPIIRAFVRAASVS